MSRIQFITHQGKQILRLDFSKVLPEDAEAIITEAKRVIASQPLGSLRTLTDLSETAFPPKVNQLMKEYAKHNKPYVKAAAVLGADGLRRALLYVAATFSSRDLAPFEDEEAAKEWLAKF